MEETGITNVELVGPIWNRTHYFPLHGFDGQNELYFMTRTPDEHVAPVFTEQELLDEGLTTMRWWTVKEIAESDQRFAPRDLATRLATLLEEGPPDVTVVLADEFPAATSE